MSQYLFDYVPVDPTTWVYLSSLLMIGLFFKFGRVWSVRNLDLILLILLAPGLMIVHAGKEKLNAEALAAASQQPAETIEPPPSIETAPAESPTGAEPSEDADADADDSQPVDAPPAAPVDAPASDAESPQDAPADGAEPAAPVAAALAAAEDAADVENAVIVAPAADPAPSGRTTMFYGFLLLLFASGLLLVRLLLDPMMVRRPLLEPNLSIGGLVFISCSLFIFLMANVINSQPTDEDFAGVKAAQKLLSREAYDDEDNSLQRHGPGNALVHLLPSLPTMPLLQSDRREEKQIGYVTVAKSVAITAHLAVVLGLVLVAYRHFLNIKMGVGAATIYLMLPYTAQMTGRVEHVVPAALLVWAVASYRRPLLAGMLMGLAMGVFYYPFFLLPLWLSFYWQRGVLRFTLGVVASIALTVLSLAFISADMTAFLANLQKMFGVWLPIRDGLEGVWGLGWDSVFRFPVLAAFICLSFSFALWPPQKNLGTLLSCSAAVMAATQFWHGFGGGLYMAWYLPLALLTIFRPNLEDRVALSVLGEAWRPRRRAGLPSIERAAFLRFPQPTDPRK